MTDLAALSDRGRAREENQDRHLVRRAKGTLLLVVADGVGGEAGGEVASTAAVDAVAASFEFRAVDIAGALASAMRTSNDAVLRVSEERALPTAATTMVAAAARGRRLAVANLGDSRAYLVRGGEARQITTDHAGETPNSITRFLGDPRGVAPDVFVEPLRRRDRLVLCSDGLTRYVSADELAKLSRGRPDRAARALVDLANERGGEDNVTVVIYAPSWQSLAPRPLVVLLLALVLAAAIMVAAAMIFAVPAV